MSTRKHLPEVLDDADAGAPSPGAPQPAAGGARRGGFMGHFLKEESQGLLSEADAARKEADELRRRLDELKASTPVRELDPQKVRPSRFANRHELAFHDADFSALAQSIKATGHNSVPILVRPRGDAFEIAYGHRRVAACKSVGVLVRAIVADLSDQELLAEMVNENEARTSPSAFETGMQLRAILDSDQHIYSTQRDLAIAFKISPGHLAKLLQFAELPPEIVAAFPDPRAIRVYWVPSLLSAHAADPEGMKAACKAARALPDDVSASAVFNRLVRSQRPKDRVVMLGTTRFAVSKTDATGTTVIRIHKNAPRDLINRLMETLATEARSIEASGEESPP